MLKKITALVGMSMSSLVLAGCYAVDYGPPPVTVVPVASSVPHYGPPAPNTNVPHYGPPAPPPVTVTPNSSTPYYGPPGPQSSNAPSYGPAPQPSNSAPSYGPAPSNAYYGPAAQRAPMPSSAPTTVTDNSVTPSMSGVIPVVKTSDLRRSAIKRNSIANSDKITAGDKTNSLPDVK